MGVGVLELVDPLLGDIARLVGTVYGEYRRVVVVRPGRDCKTAADPGATISNSPKPLAAARPLARLAGSITSFG